LQDKSFSLRICVLESHCCGITEGNQKFQGFDRSLFNTDIRTALLDLEELKLSLPTVSYESLVINEVANTKTSQVLKFP